MNTVIEKAKKAFGLKKQEKHDPGFYLLPDRPITPDKKENVRFGHQQLAGTVFELLKNAEPPFTVGLYGKWGVGKTTIALLVKEFACNNDFKCLFFDAWKYERDSLRRQFLIELDRQVFNKRLGYKEKLNQTLSEPEKIAIWDYIKRVFSSVVPRTIGILTILLVVAFIASTFFNKDKDVSTILSLAFQLGLVGTLVSFILSSFEVIKGSTQFHRTDSAEGFEDHFIEAIGESELRDKKLLVVVDNLDRVEDSKAVSILSDIKTFLSQDGNEHKILFLIPCDDQALRSQLSEIYGDGFDTDEFLRKFFNLTIKIPKFIDLDLFNYVRDLLVASKVSEFQNNSDLEGVIIYALIDNPREIKQFINSLIPQILLAHERKLGPVLKNPAFLAKLLVIRQKFPILYEIIEERSLRSQISLDASEIVDLYKVELKLKQWDDEKISRETKKFELFNGYTPGINEKNIDIFLTLRQSDEEKKIPEWKSFVLALEEGQKEDAQKIFSQIMADEKIKVLDSLLKSYLEKLKSGPSLIKLLSTILPIAQKEKQELKYFFDAAANYFPFGQDFAKVYQQFDSSTVFSFWYLNTPESKRQKISSPFVGLFAISQNDGAPTIDYEYALSLLDLLNQNPKIFYSFRLPLKQYFESTYFKHPYLARINSKEARQYFITENAGAKYVDSLIKDDFKDTDDLKSALGFWQNLKLPDSAVINSIKKYRELFDSFSTATDEEKLALCAGLFAFSKKYSDILTNE
ncbi:KAP family NTPase, partial [Patescibacteria group bacterium]|nr:KAP family NTPase [Patescibacteria group bacterium]